jgi:hypothetical protein
LWFLIATAVKLGVAIYVIMLLQEIRDNTRPKP